MAISQIILTNKDELSYEGEKFKGDGYYGYADGLHTVSFHVTNFVGRLHLEATLMEEPTAGDWFAIDLSPTVSYLDYSSQTSDTQGVTFSGNFVWLRAKVDRSHLTATQYSLASHGRMDKIVLLK